MAKYRKYESTKVTLLFDTERYSILLSILVTAEVSYDNYLLIWRIVDSFFVYILKHDVKRTYFSLLRPYYHKFPTKRISELGTNL